MKNTTKSYREIPLNSKKHPGLVAIVDEEDYDLVRQYKWHPLQGRVTFYAEAKVKKDGRYVNVVMHRLLLGLEPGDPLQGDHINHNGLDNRRSVNLRAVTPQQNSCNSKPLGGSSKYRGVYRNKRNNWWQAFIYVNKKHITIGGFQDEKEAALARDRALLKYRREFAQLNFPINQ